jgi:hypothetical protein
MNLGEIQIEMETKKLIEELYFCAAQCQHCYDACRIENKKEELEQCMIADQDCADICRLAGQLLERNSPHAEILLKACGEMCEKCATECEKHDQMEHCKRCAEACRKCADMCHSSQPAA